MGIYSSTVVENAIDLHYFAHRKWKQALQKMNSKNTFRPSAISYSYEQKLSYQFKRGERERERSTRKSRYNLKKWITQWISTWIHLVSKMERTKWNEREKMLPTRDADVELRHLCMFTMSVQMFEVCPNKRVINSSQLIWGPNSLHSFCYCCCHRWMWEWMKHQILRVFRWTFYNDQFSITKLIE